MRRRKNGDETPDLAALERHIAERFSGIEERLQRLEGQRAEPEGGLRPQESDPTAWGDELDEWTRALDETAEPEPPLPPFLRQPENPPRGPARPDPPSANTVPGADQPADDDTGAALPAVVEALAAVVEALTEVAGHLRTRSKRFYSMESALQGRPDQMSGDGR